jgi:hypothetical protein
MDYKEKLRLAKEALDSGSYDRETIEYIFPELKESEDERIRKTLIRFHKSTIDVDGIKGEDILAWLEKQGEQKDINPTLLENSPILSNSAKTGKNWTEEDEIGSDATIELLEYFINYAPEFRKPTIRRSIDWLKSLKKRMEI